MSTSVDTARQSWGGSWRMPTASEFEELNTYCTWSWTTIGGRQGSKFTSSNGNYIFFPCGGYWYHGSYSSNVGTYCAYWTSTPDGSSNARKLSCNSSRFKVSSDVRDCGFLIRPVK